MPKTPKDPTALTGGPDSPPATVEAPGKRPPKGPQPGRFDLHREGHKQGPAAGRVKRMIVPGKGRGR